MIIEIAVFGGDKDDALEEIGRAIVGGTDGERGLPDTARAI